MATPYEIDVADCQPCLTVDEAFVTDVVRRTLEAEQAASATISVAIVDNARIRELHREYLNHDCATDVISFLLDSRDETGGPEELSGGRNDQEGQGAASDSRDDAGRDDAGRDDDRNGRDESGESEDVPRACGRHLDGEVIVSTEMAIDRAADYDWSPLDEFTLYLVHGLLHLCGYDDLTESELPVMRKREEQVLERLGRPKPVRDASDRGHIDEAKGGVRNSAASEAAASEDPGSEAARCQAASSGSATSNGEPS